MIYIVEQLSENNWWVVSAWTTKARAELEISCYVENNHKDKIFRIREFDAVERKDS